VKLLFDCCKDKRDWDGMLQAAKLAFVCCDFKEDALGKATELCVEACTAKGGPGLAAQFVKSQESTEVASPFKDVPLPRFDPEGKTEGLVGQVAKPVEETGQPPALLEAAGDDLHAKVNAQLALGDFGNALADALDEMRTANQKDQMAKALADVARCFKAKDLNLIRANQFLAYQKTGQGENPLPTF